MVHLQVLRQVELTVLMKPLQEETHLLGCCCPVVFDHGFDTDNVVQEMGDIYCLKLSKVHEQAQSKVSLQIIYHTPPTVARTGSPADRNWRFCLDYSRLKDVHNSPTVRRAGTISFVGTGISRRLDAWRACRLE